MKAGLQMLQPRFFYYAFCTDTSTTFHGFR